MQVLPETNFEDLQIHLLIFQVHPKKIFFLNLKLKKGFKKIQKFYYFKNGEFQQVLAGKNQKTLDQEDDVKTKVMILKSPMNLKHIKCEV